MHNYGFFNKTLGGYTLTELPKVGSYEYIYKNDEILIKVDQFGLQTAQLRPPRRRGALQARKTGNRIACKGVF